MRWLLVTAIAQRDDVVAAQGEVIEGGSVTAPAGHIHFLGAHDVGSGAHLHAALAQRSLDERDFEFDGRAGLKIAWREEIDAAGVCGNARKTLWPGLPCWRCNAYCVAFDFTQRRHDRPQPLPNRSSPHVLSPTNSLSSPPKPVKRICAESGTASREVMGGCRIVQQ